MSAMSLRAALDLAIEPTFDRVLPGMFRSPEAIVMLLAIGLQESQLKHRRQINGPARGLWQFERGGGVKGVFGHQLTARYAHATCMLRSVSPDIASVYATLEFDDVLACAFARLLLYSDPAPLPAIGDASGAWSYYQRNWRPGRPHPETWETYYYGVVEAIK